MRNLDKNEAIKKLRSSLRNESRKVTEIYAGTYCLAAFIEWVNFQALAPESKSLEPRRIS